MGRRRKRRILSKFMWTVGLLCLAVAAYVAGKEYLGDGQEMAGVEPVPYQEVQMTEEELHNKYYYEQLSEEEQQVYKEILQGVKDGVDNIYVHLADAERTNELFQFVLKDYPEIFWCDGKSTSTGHEGSQPFTVLTPGYLYSAEEREDKKQEIETAVNEWLSGISQEASDYEKILYVYEYIVDAVDYDLEASDNQNIYSVFVGKRSVCAGYSKATQYLLERLGVFCTYVTGDTTQGQSHAWNLVQCEGQYYYVDTTWGDPVFQAAEGEQTDNHDYVSYDYMCCSEEELFKTHIPEGDVQLPACTSMEWNYYVVNHMYYDSYDSETILKAMNDVISQRSNPVVIKFASNELYAQAHDDIFQNVVKRASQNLADWYGLSEVRYQYLDEAELSKIVIYWEYE